MGENNTELKRERVIAIMLDVQGTIDNIDDATTIIFMRQLQKLRIKYSAEKVIIHVSSHLHTAESLLPYLEILHRNLPPNIVLGNAFYLFGTYNYETGEEEYKGFTFNARKTEAFENCLDTNKYDRVCVGLIDDSLNPNYITKFQNKEPIFIIRPSQKEEDLQVDNLMCHSTQTEGFDGVLEGLDAYLNSIKDIPHESIVEEQEKVLIPLDVDEIVKLCINRNFALAYRYISESNLTNFNYAFIAFELNKMFENGINLEREELEVINNIIQVLKKHKDMGDETKNKYLYQLISRNAIFY